MVVNAWFPLKIYHVQMEILTVVHPPPLLAAVSSVAHEDGKKIIANNPSEETRQKTTLPLRLRLHCWRQRQRRRQDWAVAYDTLERRRYVLGTCPSDCEPRTNSLMVEAPKYQHKAPRAQFSILQFSPNKKIDRFPRIELWKKSKKKKQNTHLSAPATSPPSQSQNSVSGYRYHFQSPPSRGHKTQRTPFACVLSFCFVLCRLA